MTVNVFESGVEMQYQVNGVLRDVDNPQNSMDFAVTA